MSSANPRWGSPRIVGELAMLGIHVAKATVERYMVRPKKPPSPTWRAFLANHVTTSCPSTSSWYQR
jgi:putative transposase